MNPYNLLLIYFICYPKLTCRKICTSVLRFHQPSPQHFWSHWEYSSAVGVLRNLRGIGKRVPWTTFSNIPKYNALILLTSLSSISHEWRWKDRTKLLPQPMLTYHQRYSVAFTGEQFHKKSSWISSITCVCVSGLNCKLPVWLIKTDIWPYCEILIPSP